MAALTSSADVFETFFDQVAVGLALADLSTSYVRVNATYASLLGRLPEDLVGVSFSTILHPDEHDGERLRLDRLLSGSESALQSEQRYVGPGGRVSWVLHSVSVVPDAAGGPAWLAVSAQDITERRRVEQELRSLTAVLTERAVRDPLTGLANRALLEERLRGALAKDSRTGGTTGVLFLDLDGFKAVNDRHGHAVGDLVLREVASRLSGAVRPSDTVARLGGDEFVVLAEGTGEEGLRALVARLQTAVDAPVRSGKLNLNVGVSIGIAVCQGGDGEPSALLSTADRRMYDAKRSARQQRKDAGREAPRSTRQSSG